MDGRLNLGALTLFSLISLLTTASYVHGVTLVLITLVRPLFFKSHNIYIYIRGGLDIWRPDFNRPDIDFFMMVYMIYK